METPYAPDRRTTEALLRALSAEVRTQKHRLRRCAKRQHSRGFRTSDLLRPRKVHTCIEKGLVGLLGPIQVHLYGVCSVSILCIYIHIGSGCSTPQKKTVSPSVIRQDGSSAAPFSLAARKRSGGRQLYQHCGDRLHVLHTTRGGLRTMLVRRMSPSAHLHSIQWSWQVVRLVTPTSSSSLGAAGGT